MSDFSGLYYLKGDNIEDGISLLKRSKYEGYVLKPVNGLIPILPEEEQWESVRPNRRIINQNIGILIHLSNCEDHGFGFNIYKDNNEICSYYIDWGGRISFEDDEDAQNYYKEIKENGVPLNVDSDNFKIESFKEMGFSNDELKVIKELLFPKEKTTENFNSFNFVREFCDYIKIEYYDWISYHYFEQNTKEDCDEYSFVKL